MMLSIEELRRPFAWTRNLRFRALLETTYAAGLRVSEVMHLRVALRAYYKVHRPSYWLFPSNQDPSTALSNQSAQHVFSRAKRLAGITKKGGIDALRHSFATHQLEVGMPIHQLHQLLGHRSIGSTMRSVHLGTDAHPARPPALPDCRGCFRYTQRAVAACALPLPLSGDGDAAPVQGAHG